MQPSNAAAQTPLSYNSWAKPKLHGSGANWVHAGCMDPQRSLILWTFGLAGDEATSRWAFEVLGKTVRTCVLSAARAKGWRLHDLLFLRGMEWVSEMDVSALASTPAIAAPHVQPRRYQPPLHFPEIPPVPSVACPWKEKKNKKKGCPSWPNPPAWGCFRAPRGLDLKMIFTRRRLVPFVILQVWRRTIQFYCSIRIILFAVWKKCLHMEGFG